MNTIVKPIRNTILHIRSKDATQLTMGLNTNFSIQIVSAIEAAEDQEIHAQLISAEIPNSAYNISSAVKNNTIIYDTNQIFTFPDQNYDLREILRMLNADTLFPFTATHNKYTNKITLTNNTAVSHTIEWTQSLSNKLLGYGESLDETILAGETTSSLGMLDLATIHSIFIKSDLSAGNVLSTRAGNSTTLQKISIDQNSYGIVYLNQQDFRTVSVLQKPSISHIIFSITDQNDNLLDLNDINFEFSIQFMIFPRSKQISGGESRRTLERINKPFQQIIQAPIQPVEGNDVVEIQDANSTHPIEGKTHLEDVAEKTILDHIIDRL